MNGPGQILATCARKYGDQTALVTQDRTMSFVELYAAATAVAAALRDAGVRQGETVSLFSQNRWEWLVAYHGALQAGAVVNPINVMLTPAEVEYVLADCRSSAVFVGETQVGAVVDVVTRLPQRCRVIAFGTAVEGTVPFADLLTSTATAPDFEPDPTSPCTIGYTSGTTGHPKGAVQSHRAVFRNIALTATMHGKTETDVVVTALPAPHVYGNVAINGTWLAGGTVVVMERFSSTEALRLAAEHRATMIEGVPAMYAAMLADPTLGSTDLSSLTRCTVGGQTMPVPVIERWEEVSGAPLLELWGMTEVAGLGTTHPVHCPGPKGSIGVTLPGVEARIRRLDAMDETASVGEAGELQVRGPIVMEGYFNNAGATAEVLGSDGWLSTGDVAYADDEGYLFIVDRLKDMIITGGYNVYPAEIERVMSKHPDVAMVAVAAVPDEVKGELACAYVVRRAGSESSEDDLLGFASAELAPYKRPRLIRFVDDLPKTSSGKIMRRKLQSVYTSDRT